MMSRHEDVSCLIREIIKIVRIEDLHILKQKSGILGVISVTSTDIELKLLFSILLEFACALRYEPASKWTIFIALFIRF